MPSSTPIIIDALLADPNLTAEERSRLQDIKAKTSPDILDRIFILGLVERSLRS